MTGKRKVVNQDAEILVIGLGNKYRQDDGVGIYIARKLKLEKLSRTIVKSERGEGISLMESWNQTSVAILVDAMNSGASPGTIRRFDTHTQSIPKGFFPHSAHHFGVAEAVGLAKAINRVPPCLIIYGIEGKRFEQGVGLSPEVERASRDVIKMVIKDTCREYGTQSNS